MRLFALALLAQSGCAGVFGCDENHVCIRQPLEGTLSGPVDATLFEGSRC